MRVENRNKSACLWQSETSNVPRNFHQPNWIVRTHCKFTFAKIHTNKNWKHLGTERTPNRVWDFCSKNYLIPTLAEDQLISVVVFIRIGLQVLLRKIHMFTKFHLPSPIQSQSCAGNLCSYLPFYCADSTWIFIVF